MRPELPKLFGLLPKTKLEVRPVQDYREKEAASAEYNQGTPDGSRPGVVYVNTGDYQHRSLISTESTAYHEGLPGHHMQISIAQTLPGLPPFRQHAFYGAYIEGWALYSERLGKDIGFYQDPYSDFGRLSDELLRAVRLVLDTPELRDRWPGELAAMRDRINAVRKRIASVDPRLAYIGNQFGMFSMLPLSREKVLALREKHAIYMADSGRFNVVGLGDDQIDRFTAAMVEALDA
jgi:uncharacterized protein (DUF885 family)